MLHTFLPYQGSKSDYGVLQKARVPGRREATLGPKCSVFWHSTAAESTIRSHRWQHNISDQRSDDRRACMSTAAVSCLGKTTW